ncbi:MAG: hypothetical protein EXS14_02765 [Planctomycetes bacterium]|nr:hypothetical protein [Planctomycetota bacterium]
MNEEEGAELRQNYRVKLVVDGVERPLKPFLHNMLGGAAMGLVEALKDVNEPQHVVLEVERD